MCQLLLGSKNSVRLFELCASLRVAEDGNITRLNTVKAQLFNHLRQQGDIKTVTQWIKGIAKDRDSSQDQKLETLTALLKWSPEAKITACALVEIAKMNKNLLKGMSDFLQPAVVLEILRLDNHFFDAHKTVDHRSAVICKACCDGQIAIAKELLAHHTPDLAALYDIEGSSGTATRNEALPKGELTPENLLRHIQTDPQGFYDKFSGV